MRSIFINPVQELVRFVWWWLVLGPREIIRWTYNTLLNFDEMLVLGPTVRLWFSFEPLFGDYNWQGRVIGFFLRSIRIIITCLLYASVVVVGLGLIGLWWLWPVVAVTMIFNLW